MLGPEKYHNDICQSSRIFSLKYLPLYAVGAKVTTGDSNNNGD